MAFVRSVNTGGPPRISGPQPNPNAGAGAPPMPGAMHATIGHHPDPDSDEPPDLTTAYWFLRGGQAYVECTLQPGGGHVVARVNVADSYEVFNWGDRVTLVACNGDPNSSMVVGKLHDDNDPLPATVAGGIKVEGAVFDPDTNARFAKRIQFLRTNADTVLVLETVGNGDMVLYSGAGVSIEATNGGWVVINGEHVVLGAQVEIIPVPGEVIGEDIVPGIPMIPPIGEPGATGTDPPYNGLMDAIVRARDKFQATPITDAVFFTYLTALEALVAGIAASPVLLALDPDLGPLLTTFQAVPKPTSLTCEAMSATQKVEARG